MDGIESRIVEAGKLDLDEPIASVRPHLGESNGEPYAHHIGGGLGFRSELRIYPRLDRAIAVTGNETSFDTGAVAESAAAPGTSRRDT